MPSAIEVGWNAVPITVPQEDIFQEVDPNRHLEVISGNIEILDEIRSNTKHYYLVDVEKESLLKENTFYFPGWKLYINGKEELISYDHQYHPGIITFKTAAGKKDIELIFEDTNLRKYSNLISLSSLFLSGSFLLMNPLLKRRLIFGNNN